MSNHEKHIELIEKHINFIKTSDGLNSSIQCFYEHGRASGTFLQQLKLYAEEYRNSFAEPIIEQEVNSGIVKEKNNDERIISVNDVLTAKKLISEILTGMDKNMTINVLNNMITDFCQHENIDRKDGLDECLDCGARNF